MGVYTGIQHLSLKHGQERETYENGQWHHDGCGQRLKAFIYVNDVDELTHPTTIAAGTHKTVWYPNTGYFAGDKVGTNKLNESYILKEYAPVITRMLAKAGGGFIFDTNALHGADMGPE